MYVCMFVFNNYVKNNINSNTASKIWIDKFVDFLNYEYV